MVTQEQQGKLSVLSAAERRARQRLYLRDAGALGTLLLLAIGLSFVTWGLFHSFNAHRHMLEARWRARGEAALTAGKPVAALDDLHSALAYAPDDRGLQIELATALAAAGRTQEAQVYFSTLLETAPGNGPINLQLARIAIRQGNTQVAVEHYQAAIEGTWNGDAFTRRRDIRLELARFFLAQHRNGEARDLLLVASSNSPADYPLQLTLGGLLEQAGDPAGALEVYRRAAGHRPTRVEALTGEARAAEALGRYGTAKQWLQQAAGDPGFSKTAEPLRTEAQARLERVQAMLLLYPSENLPNGERARRIAHLAGLAQTRLAGCPVATLPAAPATPVATQPAAPLADLAAHLAQLNPLAHREGGPAEAPPGTTAGDSFSALAARWAQLPAPPALERQLEHDPALAQGTLQLVYATARATANGSCGAFDGPSNGASIRENALLTRMAEVQNPGEEQP